MAYDYFPSGRRGVGRRGRCPWGCGKDVQLHPNHDYPTRHDCRKKPQSTKGGGA